MLGAVAIVVVIVVVLPPLFLVTGSIVSAVLGTVLGSNADDQHAGSELIGVD